MRTALLTAKTHNGEALMLCKSKDELLKNRAAFMELRKICILEGAHDKYASVSYQESDGGEELLNFRTPDAQKKFLAERARERKAQADRIAKLNDADAKREKPDIDLQEKRKAEKEAEIAAIRKTSAPFGYGKDGKPLTEPAK